MTATSNPTLANAFTQLEQLGLNPPRFVRNLPEAQQVPDVVEAIASCPEHMFVAFWLGITPVLNVVNSRDQVIRIHPAPFRKQFSLGHAVKMDAQMHQEGYAPDFEAWINNLQRDHPLQIDYFCEVAEPA